MKKFIMLILLPVFLSGCASATSPTPIPSTFIPIAPSKISTPEPTETSTLVPTATQDPILNQLILDVENHTKGNVKVNADGELITKWDFLIPSIQVFPNGEMVMNVSGWGDIKINANEINIYEEERKVVVSGFHLNLENEEWIVKEFSFVPFSAFGEVTIWRDGSGIKEQYDERGYAELMQREILPTDLLDKSLFRYLQTQSMGFDSSKFNEVKLSGTSGHFLVGDPSTAPNYLDEGAAPWRLREPIGVLFDHNTGRNFIVCPVEFANPEFPDDPSKNIWVIGLSNMFYAHWVPNKGNSPLNWYSITNIVHRLSAMRVPSFEGWGSPDFDYTYLHALMIQFYGSQEEFEKATDKFLGPQDDDYFHRNIDPAALEGGFLPLHISDIPWVR